MQGVARATNRGAKGQAQGRFPGLGSVRRKDTPRSVEPVEAASSTPLTIPIGSFRRQGTVTSAGSYGSSDQLAWGTLSSTSGDVSWYSMVTRNLVADAGVDLSAVGLYTVTLTVDCDITPGTGAYISLNVEGLLAGAQFPIVDTAVFLGAVTIPVVNNGVSGGAALLIDATYYGAAGVAILSNIYVTRVL